MANPIAENRNEPNIDIVQELSDSDKELHGFDDNLLMKKKT